MSEIIKEWYVSKKEISFIKYRCPSCLKVKILNKRNFVRKKYSYCQPCYQKSPERKLAAQKNVKNRRSYLGVENPNYRGKTIRHCKCGKSFLRRVSPSQRGTRFHLYCSQRCKKRFSVSISDHTAYRGNKFRSSWEYELAKFFDSIGWKWEYEPQSFETPYGWYTPDFKVKYRGYVEVKGFFRDENSKNKYEWFAENHKTILADRSFFIDLGFRFGHGRKLISP